MKFSHITNVYALIELIEWHNSHSLYVVVDFETTSKDPRQAKLVDIQMTGYDQNEAVLFDPAFLPLLQQIDVPLVWWNMKYDLKVAYFHGIDLRKKCNVDAMLIDHLNDENREHSLDSHVQELFQDDYKEQFWDKYDNYIDAPFSERLEYACKDIVYTGRVYRKLLLEMDTPEFMLHHVHRLALALLDAEIKGIQIDLDFTIQTGTELKADILKAEFELRTLGGYHCDAIELELWAKEIDKAYTPKGKKWKSIEKPEFNFSSSDQVARLLYDGLKLPVQINRKTRKRTADDKALEVLEFKHPIIPEIRKLRKYSKMYGSFIEGVLDKVVDGRIYPSFNVNGTVTGRISHSEPNMGQMPSKGDWAKIRGIFIPDAGHKLITCDYGQLEVCIAAHYSQDKNLLKIINEGESKHDITANSLGIPRGTAKTLNFAQQYLCGPKKVAEIVGCSASDGEYYWNKYWETYSGEKQVIDECKAKVDAGIPIENPFGRKRHFPKEFDGHWAKEAAYRQAYSSLIQGTGSDLTSYSFYTIAEELSRLGIGRAWFTVHDEILLQVEDNRVEQARELVQKVMIHAGNLIKLTIPLSVECSQGLTRWQK